VLGEAKKRAPYTKKPSPGGRWHAIGVTACPEERHDVRDEG